MILNDVVLGKDMAEGGGNKNSKFMGEMESLNELRVTEMASGSEIPNRNEVPASENSKEEGEVSSSDDDGQPVESPAMSNDNVLASKVGVSIQPAGKYTHVNPSGKISGTRLVSIRPQTSTQPNNQKNFKKKQVPFNSTKSGWYKPPDTDRNLVISFSDDEDSASECELHEQEKVLQAQSNMLGMVDNRRPPASSLPKSRRIRQTDENLNKLLPNNLSLNRTFNGGTNMRGSGPASVGQKSQVRSHDVLNSNLENQERKYDHILGLNRHKLQDLRQQIAFRESQLKVKVGQQMKDSDSVSRKEYNATNFSNDATRKCNATSTDVRQPGLKEPDRKRIKVGGACSTHLILEGRPQVSAAKSILSSKMPVLEKISEGEGNKVALSLEGISMSKKESRNVQFKRQNDERVDTQSGNIPASDVDGCCNQSERTSSRVDHNAISHCIKPPANKPSTTLPTDRINDINNPGTIGGHSNVEVSSIYRATREGNSVKSSDFRQLVVADKAPNTLINTKHKASLNTANPWRCSANENVSGRSDIDLQSLTEMEESLDKELEEAQEHRRTCEIEERNALKAYRKAQRHLIEANARCVEFYRRREVSSAHFRSFIMDDSSLLLSSRQHGHDGNEVDTINGNISNVDLISKSHQVLGYELIQGTSCGPRDMLYMNDNRQNLGSEQCSEPDASTSDMLHGTEKDTTNKDSSPSNNQDILLEEYEDASPMEHEPVGHHLECRDEEQNIERYQNDARKESETIKFVDGTQDSLLLEAELRSKLFARLGIRADSKKAGSCFNAEPAIEQGAENDTGNGKGTRSDDSVHVSGIENNQQYEFGGTNKPQTNASPATMENEEHRAVGKTSLKYHYTDVEGIEYSHKELLPEVSAAFSAPSTLKSAFRHLKIVTPTAVVESENRYEKTQKSYRDDTQRVDLLARTISEREIGSYSCDLKVDPLQPLCMYELRGKCNNDACPWQHLKDISDGRMYQHPHDCSDNIDCKIGLTKDKEKSDSGMELSICSDVLTPPTYLVGLDILQGVRHSYETVVARRTAQYWCQSFSTSLVLSNLIQNDHPVDQPFLHGSDGRIEVQGSWSRQQSYFQSKHGIMNQVKQGLSVAVQPLEMALCFLDLEVNRVEAVKKALGVLSRSLEADPTSEVLWILYLIIYYNNTKFVGKDDMFSHAVKHVEDSYTLWIMYINSRILLDDRLAAYDASLSVLCRHSSGTGTNEIHASACVLDLFLQMMDCLCMSGNVEKAIQRICGLLSDAETSDEPLSFMSYDILTCLTISDKCVFWVCCVYLVIYRKLPDAILLKFEFEKDLFAIEWPYVHLEDDEKQRAIRLIEKGVDSVEVYMKNESFEKENDLRSVHFFALSHLRFMVALNGSKCCRSLLEKYVRLYPSCLEFVLISARMLQIDSGDTDFAHFEDALSNWPKQAPGIQCIWNQFAEYALQKGKTDFAKELMVRWFNSAWNIQYPHNGILEPTNCDNILSSFEVVSSKPDRVVTYSNQIDMMFGFLNLSLHNLLHQDQIGARSAIEHALKAAPENFMHCMREHALFVLSDDSQLKGNFPLSFQVNTLNRYLYHARSFPLSEPLSKKFIFKIEKPRARQLVCKLLGPDSSDFYIVNLVLEAWYGPSLLPQNFNKPKDLVDFVEAILELVPSNYPLAFSVCKFLSNGCSNMDLSSGSIMFWAHSVLVNAIFHAIPIPPEYIWVEAAGILENSADTRTLSKRFYKKALSVYPFSVKLWRYHYNLSKNTGNISSVTEAAKERGIKLC